MPGNSCLVSKPRNKLNQVCSSEFQSKNPTKNMATQNTNLSSFLWSVADLLRGDYKPSDYGKVILPFTVLRRLDCVLE